jgi:myo-inositol-1(or 4)-monophosphatase
MDMSWCDGLPSEISPSAFREFTQRFCEIADSVSPVQDQMVADPALLSNFEWRLEQRFVTLIRDVFGPIQILAEEYFARHGSYIGGNAGISLTLDPLDGSASYTRGSDRFASAVAVLIGTTPVAALVYQPAERRLYTAIAGRGAWLDGRPTRHLARECPRVLVVKAQWMREPAMAERVRALVSAGYQLERMESTSLKLCWLAGGDRAGLIKWLSRRNGVVMVWGTVPGLVVCGEFGLRPYRLDGSPWTGQDGGLVIGDRRCLGDLGWPAADAS